MTEIYKTAALACLSLSLAACGPSQVAEEDSEPGGPQEFDQQLSEEEANALLDELEAAEEEAGQQSE